MKNKLIILFLFTLSLFIFSCNNTTEPPPVDVPSLLTGKIAFISTDSGKSVLYSINPDGTELKQINSTVNSGTLKWSPDGEQIAFTAPSTFGSEAVYVMNADGSNVRLLPTVPEQLARGNWPDWSPDGSKIVFTHGRIIDPIGVYETVIVDLFNGTTQEFKNDYITDVGYISDVAPKWSPDGKKIIFLSNRDYLKINYAKEDLYIMDFDGNNIKRLTQYGANISYLWNPSEKSIFFSVYSSTGGVNDGLYMTDTSGNIHQFSDMASTGVGSISTDKKSLAFASDGQIYILNIAAGNIAKVIVNGMSDLKYAPLTWSIDDKELLTMSVTKDFQNRYLDMVNVKTGIPKRLVQFNKIQSADWHK